MTLNNFLLISVLLAAGAYFLFPRISIPVNAWISRYLFPLGGAIKLSEEEKKDRDIGLAADPLNPNRPANILRRALLEFNLLCNHLQRTETGTRSALKILSICDSPTITAPFTQSLAQAFPEREISHITGARELSPGAIVGLFPDNSEKLLQLDTFDAAILVVNHLQGPTGFKELEVHLAQNGVKCASITCPDGHLPYEGQGSATL